MSDSEKIFAANLKAARRKRGWSQERLGEKIGYSEKAVSKWETARALPPTEALLQISSALGISLDTLFSAVPKTSGIPEYYIGIDGGGTKTDFVIADDEQIIRQLRLGPCNPYDLGFDEACRVLDEGIQYLLAEVPPEKCTLFAGISGGGKGEMKMMLKGFFSSYRFAMAENAGDIENIITAGLAEEDGIAVIMGTGSVVYAVRGGERRRFGGYGDCFDHGGSAYAIARDAITAALLYEDGCGPYTALADLIKHQRNVNSMFDTLVGLYDGRKKVIASLTPLCIEAAEAGDPVAIGIIKDNISRICMMINAARSYMGHPCRIVFSGSLIERAKSILSLVREELGADAQISVLGDSPVSGALSLAKKMAKEGKQNA